MRSPYRRARRRGRPLWPRSVARLLPTLVALGAFVCLLATATHAFAYPWMLKHGYGGCGTCHTDPSGGELLTDYGRAQGDLLVRMMYGKDEVSAAASSSESDAGFDDFDSFDAPAPAPASAAPASAAPAPAAPAPLPASGGQTEASAPSEAETPPSAFLWGLYQTPEWLLLGGSYRHLSVIEPGSDFKTFPMQMDLYGQMRFAGLRASGSLGVARVEAGSPHTRAAQLTTNQGKDWNLLSRTHWLGYDFSGQTTLRAGRLNLPFGVRIPEHTFWVREATRTDRESDQEHGVALSYSGQGLRGEIMAVLGNYQLGPDKYRSRGVSAFAEYLLADTSAIGVSSLVTRSAADRFTLTDQATWRHAHGLMTRVTIASDIVLLAEVDALIESRRALGYVGFVQADYEVVQGLHLLATGELLDAGKLDSARTSRGAGEPTFGAWLSVDWFFYRQLEFRLDVQAREDSTVTFLPQLHAYL